MTSLPHSQLFLGQNVSVVISGQHIQVVKTQTGEVVKTTATFEGLEKDAVIKSGPIRCADVDASFTHVVTSGEDKQLKVWRLEDLKLLNERELPKKPTEVHFTRDGQTILVSDKFGDVFSYPLEYTPQSNPDPAAETTEEQLDPRDQIISHENPSGGSLILGHTSLLTSFLLTEDEQYIVSADRDEHIRVSWYPQGYVIERYCLGHKKFVHAVHIPKFAPSILVSGGGDPMLKLWHWMSGELLCDIPISEVVEPLIAVRPRKGHRAYDEGEGDGEVKLGKRKRRRGKGKATVEDGVADGQDQTVDAEDPTTIEDVTMKDAEERNVGTVEPAAAGVKVEASEDPLVLVIHKIASVDVAGQGRFLVFNAVGASAIFFCRFPEGTKTAEAIPVQSFPLGSPVINFTIGSDGRIWALVDGERDVDAPASRSLVRLLDWRSGQLAEDSESTDSNALLKSLNSSCKIDATSEDIQKLDLYAALSAMPKHVDPEHDPFEGNSSRTNIEQSNGKHKGKELSQREQARQKKKQAVLAKIQEQTGGSREASVSVDQRDSKKVKSVNNE